MRFRFLGDGDCPDWLLAEINLLSQVTLNTTKMIGELIAKYLINEAEIDENEIKELILNEKLEIDDGKAIIAAVELILTSSARYGVCSADLNSELQQLGLPREHSNVMCRLHTDYYSHILENLTKKSLRLNHLSSMEIMSGDKDEVALSLPFTKMSLKLKKLDGTESTVFINVPRSDIPVLLEELKTARTIMDGI